MKRILIVLLALALPIAAVAAGKQHIKTADQDCIECHATQEQVWLDSKHGMLGVKCVVCHGSPEQNFDPKPGMNRCRGCHAGQVADVKKNLSPKERSCFVCHEGHRVTVRADAKIKSGFHKEGGAGK